MEPDRILNDVPIYLGAVDLDVVDPNPEMERRFGPRTEPNRSGPDTGCRYPAFRNPVGSYRGRSTTGTVRRWSPQVRNVQPDVSGTGPTPTLPGLGTQSEFDRFKDGVPNMTGPGLQNRLPGGSDGSDPTQTPEAVLMDTVARLQLEVEAMQFGLPGHQTFGRPTSPV